MSHVVHGVPAKTMATAPFKFAIAISSRGTFPKVCSKG